MNIITILENLYMNKHCDWIKKLDDNQIEPFIIQKWLIMNDTLRVQVHWLDKYVFTLPPKMYLSLAWSVLPKVNKMPFVKFYKSVDEQLEFDFILKKMRKQFELSDNDFNTVKYRLIKYIKDDLVYWFSYYGVKKSLWKQHYINFNLIKEFGEDTNPLPQKTDSLDKWGL